MSQKECQDRWYQKNKKRHIKNVAIRKARQIAENQKRIIAYLEIHPCVDCGETDIIVLQFDHVRGKKRAEIGRMMTFSWSTIEKEIAKCEVRCANDHIRRTAVQQKSYKVLWTAGVSGNIPPS